MREDAGRLGTTLVVLFVATFCAGAARAEHPAVARARAAIAAGRVSPERDLAPLIEALRRSRVVEERRELVGAIEGLGEPGSESPNAVKSYLREHAAPVLLQVAKEGADPFLQGDAITALRELRVPRSVLAQAATIAEADPDSFVRSRGEILRNYIAGLPAEDEAQAERAVDPERRRAAIALLDQMHVTVGTEALRSAARDALPQVVAALLDAGVAPDAGATDLAQTPLYHATFLGCSGQGAETEWLVETVRRLVEAGADLARRDDNGNTALMSAAQMCGPLIVGLLVDAGAEIDSRNGSGISPLGMALIMHKLDAAELLVARGARLTAQETEMLRAAATDARSRALIKKASAG